MKENELQIKSRQMKKNVMLLCLCLLSCIASASADNRDDGKADNEETTTVDQKSWTETVKSRLTIGGYGEAVYSRNYYSNAWNRYKSESTIESYKGAKHSQFDLPHVVIYLGYDFGKGWTMGSEIEFEHGGTESAIEIEDDEGGEYESEIERGGEVALEQFWIQKSFCNELNVRVGHIIVPVGGTNQYHMPVEFFGVYRPDGENTILPCTWHETGVSVWGRAGDWRYEALLIAGLDSDRFTREGWVSDGSGSPYEFKIANAMAGAFRIDNYSIRGLRLSISGYMGNSFSNTLSQPSSSYDDIKGTVAIGAFDFYYNDHNWIARGNFDYGYLSNSAEITTWNKNMRSDSPSSSENVASNAIAAGIEVGYDIFSQIAKMREQGRKLYAFARYDFYDSMYKTKGGVLKYDWCGRNRLAAGLNYFPMKEIVLKGEYSIGLMRSPYNNEPSISFGIAYSGFFTK